MDNLNLSIINSLDGKDESLLAYIPYLLQDLWEIGSSPEIIIQVLEKHRIISKYSQVLDLGCGKGAISVNLAKEFDCYVYGIDAMPEFIEEANYWSDKFHIKHLCTFEVGDIRQKIKDLKNFDLIVLGSIGSVFGNIEDTLVNIGPALANDAYVIVDDGYIPDKSEYKNENYLKKSEAEKQIQKAGYKIVEASVIENEYMVESDTAIYNSIEERAHELMLKFPENKQLFVDYLKNQRIENDILENKIECVTWLLKKSD